MASLAAALLPFPTISELVPSIVIGAVVDPDLTTFSVRSQNEFEATRMDVLPTQLINPPPLVKLFFVISHLLDALTDTFDEVNAMNEEKVQPLNVQEDISTMFIGEELR